MYILAGELRRCEERIREACSTFQHSIGGAERPPRWAGLGKAFRCRFIVSVNEE
jgi:hypothetical protein